ncbi:hypothetical protein HYPSUDRAFT_204975 [Hypholoma sublateritium FD-334 SS-4]|uniref:Uncharacterized protein n=1 Tax=Hypholoma sublateritium (strain FD-334 SS-4) TaxID=945553 RepID=A0A0D2PFE6_HYPSF|nr:hypothetical protein HYPSUDRAFT_204975 [Hypholoma sublateritium FD-334 SS-4]
MDQDITTDSTPPPPFPQPASSMPAVPSSPLLPPPHQFTQAGQPQRNYQQPARYLDVSPEPLQLLKEENEQSTGLQILLAYSENIFTGPPLILTLLFPLKTFTERKGLLGVAQNPCSPPPSPALAHRNQTVEVLMNWKDSGAATKSDAEVNRLVKDVLLDPNFRLGDLEGFNAAR